MSKVQTVDPYISHYVYEKQTNPDSVLVWKSYQKRIVDQVDRIVELSRGNRDFVKTDNDWRIVEELINFFASEWPREFNEFKKAIPDIRQSRRSGGYSESREIKYVGAVPPRLERMVRAIFPDQQWDKKFVNKLVKKFPLFKVGGEQ